MLHRAGQRAHRQQHRLRLDAPCVHIGALVTVYCGDALQIAPTLQHINAVIADPPYGVGYDFTKRRRSHHPGLQRGGVPGSRWTANIRGDDPPLTPPPGSAIPRYPLGGRALPCPPAAQGWIVWEKRDGSTPDDHAGCELAWSNVPGSSQVHWQKWRGIVRAGEKTSCTARSGIPPKSPWLSCCSV